MVTFKALEQLRGSVHSAMSCPSLGISASSCLPGTAFPSQATSRQSQHLRASTETMFPETEKENANMQTSTLVKCQSPPRVFRRFSLRTQHGCHGSMGEARNVQDRNFTDLNHPCSSRADRVPAMLVSGSVAKVLTRTINRTKPQMLRKFPLGHLGFLWDLRPAHSYSLHAKSG